MFARIAGVGSFLPGSPVSNDDLAQRGLDTSDEWIATRTGIRSRHLADPSLTSSELAFEASLRALEAAGTNAAEIDLIVVATSTPDYIFPSTACLLQGKLGNVGAMTFDVQAVCSGFVYALSVAEKFIRSGSHKKALVVGIAFVREGIEEKAVRTVLINLHSHLEGRVRPATAAALAQRAGVPEPAGGWEQAIQLDGPADLTVYLEKVASTYPLFTDLDAVARICAEAVEDAAAEGLATFLDVSDPESIEQFANLIGEELGPIDLWVNNAGVLDPMGPVRDADPRAVRQALEVNVGGVIDGSATFARRARTWPAARRVLVNISSGAATSVYSGWSVYGATKAAVDHFTEILDVEEPDLACFAVAPGVVDTGMQEQIRTHDETTFPAIARFRELHETGAWNSPAWVADHLAGLLAGSLRPDGVVYRVPNEPRG